jgi:hypothetical protein
MYVTRGKSTAKFKRLIRGFNGISSTGNDIDPTEEQEAIKEKKNAEIDRMIPLLDSKISDSKPMIDDVKKMRENDHTLLHNVIEIGHAIKMKKS